MLLRDQGDVLLGSIVAPGNGRVGFTGFELPHYGLAVDRAELKARTLLRQSLLERSVHSAERHPEFAADFKVGKSIGPHGLCNSQHLRRHSRVNMRRSGLHAASRQMIRHPPPADTQRARDLLLRGACLIQDDGPTTTMVVYSLAAHSRPHNGDLERACVGLGAAGGLESGMENDDLLFDACDTNHDVWASLPIPAGLSTVPMEGHRRNPTTSSSAQFFACGSGHASTLRLGASIMIQEILTEVYTLLRERLKALGVESHRVLVARCPMARARSATALIPENWTIVS